MAGDQSLSNDSPELWRHPKPEGTAFYDFQQRVKQKHGVDGDYHDLWRWSVEQPAAFWEEIWHYTGIKAQKPYNKVCSFFEGL